MEKELSVIPECYIDTNLVNSLIGKKCNHQKGCPMVFKVMNERMGDSFAIGVIDKDKREPKAMTDFSLICNDHYIYVYKHVTRPHYILQVAPAEEVFILHAAEEMSINMADYGLPSELEKLKLYTKKVDARSDSLFSSLFSVLQYSPTIAKMKKILGYLLDYKYTADSDIIRSYFDED